LIEDGLIERLMIEEPQPAPSKPWLSVGGQKSSMIQSINRQSIINPPITKSSIHLPVTVFLSPST
jgi:hypothetical protein